MSCRSMVAVLVLLALTAAPARAAAPTAAELERLHDALHQAAQVRVTITSGAIEVSHVRADAHGLRWSKHGEALVTAPGSHAAVPWDSVVAIEIRPHTHTRPTGIGFGLGAIIGVVVGATVGVGIAYYASYAIAPSFGGYLAICGLLGGVIGTYVGGKEPPAGPDWRIVYPRSDTTAAGLEPDTANASARHDPAAAAPAGR